MLPRRQVCGAAAVAGDAICGVCRAFASPIAIPRVLTTQMASSAGSTKSSNQPRSRPDGDGTAFAATRIGGAVVVTGAAGLTAATSVVLGTLSAEPEPRAGETGFGCGVGVDTGAGVGAGAGVGCT